MATVVSEPTPASSPIQMTSLWQHDDFIQRHIGPGPQEVGKMLAVVGAQSLDDLIDSTVPASIRIKGKLRLPEPTPEHVALERLFAYAGANQTWKSYIGMGY